MGDANTSVYTFFWMFQVSIILFLPTTILYLLDRNLYDVIQKANYLTVLVLLGSAIFNFCYYFREPITKKVLAKYTYKYRFIENNPTISFLLFIFLPTILIFPLYMFTIMHSHNN